MLACKADEGEGAADADRLAEDGEASRLRIPAAATAAEDGLPLLPLPPPPAPLSLLLVVGAMSPSALPSAVSSADGNWQLNTSSASSSFENARRRRLALDRLRVRRLSVVLCSVLRRPLRRLLGRDDRDDDGLIERFDGQTDRGRQRASA